MFQNNRINDYEDFDLTVSMVDFALFKHHPLNFSYKKENREFYGLMYILNGEVEHVINNAALCAEKHDVIFMKKGDTYQFNSCSDNGLEYIVISFDITPCKYLDILPLENINKLSNHQRIKELFSYIEELWFAKKIGYKLQARSMVQSLIYELLQDKLIKALGSHILPNIQATVDYMEDYFDRIIDIDSLAEISGYCSAHYRRKFKEIYGVTPIEYLNNTRVKKAKDMLRSNLFSVDEIACQCGFNNRYYFSRVFKKITGSPPRKY